MIYDCLCVVAQHSHSRRIRTKNKYIFSLHRLNLVACTSLCWFAKRRTIPTERRTKTKTTAEKTTTTTPTTTKLQSGIGDANDIWKIMIAGGRENETVLTVTSKLLIVHYLQNCALTTSGKQLPKWGFEQQEVTCNPNIRDRNAYWNVEDNAFDKCKYNNYYHPLYPSTPLSIACSFACCIFYSILNHFVLQFKLVIYYDCLDWLALARRFSFRYNFYVSWVCACDVYSQRIEPSFCHLFSSSGVLAEKKTQNELLGFEKRLFVGFFQLQLTGKNCL